MQDETESSDSQPSRTQTKQLSGYDVFLLALAVYSMLNLILLILPLNSYQTRVVLIIDGLVGLLFLLDFVYRFVSASDRRRYFFRQFGWLDLMAGFPLPGFRVAKLIRLRPTIHDWRKQGLIRGLRQTSSTRATVTLLIAVFFTFLVVQFGSMLVIGPEQRAAGSNIHTAEDALWWSYVTITTVGYGDYYPVTTQGRIVGVFMLSLGIGLFGVITSFLANIFIYPRKERLKEQERQVRHQQSMDELRVGVDALRAELHTLTEDVRRLSSELDRSN